MPAEVSIILPVHDAEPWLDECLRSVLQQDFQGSMELSVFNDGSKDKSMTIVEKWKVKLEGSGILVVIGGHNCPSPRGVGYAKNQAIAQSSGSYLCFLDSVFTSHGPTVVMPTWFCSRAWFSHVGPFDEGGRGVPEDLLFFYDHLRRGGGVVRVDQSLLLYRFRPGAATQSILESTIWTHRVCFLEERALRHWATFTIWNAGRQGRRLYRSLSEGVRRKVVAFCDVDKKKIKKGFYCYEESQECAVPKLRPQPSPPAGKAEAPGARPALPSCPATLCHLREAGPHRGCTGGQPEVPAPAGGPGLPSLQLTALSGHTQAEQRGESNCPTASPVGLVVHGSVSVSQNAVSLESWCF
ncbi:queuosine-tRNA galactosyltransferase isoform X10 [Rhinolophus sinicus]|uniref:queuosine-tRNA galactosyltransferase isoform X10 n=1 Tax=Rhinolophus sinicus TaxID=89399 RepID=UPI003D7A52F9